MTLESIITLFSACGILLVGQRFYLIDPRSRLNQAFFLLSGLLAWLSFAWFGMSQTASMSEAHFYKRLVGVWPFAILLILFCTWRYAGMHQKRIPKWSVYTVGGLLLVGALYFSYVDVFTAEAHGQLHRMESGLWGITINQMGFKDWLRGIWLFLTLFASILFTYIKYLDTEDLSRKKWPRIASFGVLFTLIFVFCATWLIPATGQVFPCNQSIQAFFGVLIFGSAYSDFKLFELKPESAFDNIAHLMTNILILTNRHFQIQHINEAACQTFNVNPKEVLNDNIQQLLGVENQSDWLSGVRASLEKLKKNEKYSKEFILKIGDNEKILLLTVSPIYNRIGKETGFAFLGTDLTDYKRSEEKLKDYAKNLKKSNHALERFAYIASHDLKEPVRTAGGFLTLLERRLRPQLNEETSGYFAYIKESIARLNTLLETTRTVSKYSDLIINPVEINTRVVVGKIRRNLGKIIEEKNARIHYNYLPIIKADEKHLEMLFQNLILNGLLYNESEAPKVTITCRLIGNDWFEFSVSDNGIGIDPAFQDQIFQMFKRLHNRSKYQGSGVGLAISRQIVEKHKGRMWVESKEGEGSIFKFTLPAIEESSQSKPLAARQSAG